MDRTRGQKRDGGQILRLFAILVGQYRGKRNVGGGGEGGTVTCPGPFLASSFPLRARTPKCSSQKESEEFRKGIPGRSLDANLGLEEQRERDVCVEADARQPGNPLLALCPSWLDANPVAARIPETNPTRHGKREAAYRMWSALRFFSRFTSIATEHICTMPTRGWVGFFSPYSLSAPLERCNLGAHQHS